MLIFVVCQHFEYCTCFHLGKPATKTHMLLILYKISNIRRATKHVKKNLPFLTTIPKHWSGANRANTGYIIFKGLGLVSQQKLSSSKLFCCFHSNHYIRRTLDLRSLLLGGYCSTQASFARASASYLSSPHPTPHANHQHQQITNLHRHILTQKSHTTRVSLARNCLDIHAKTKSAHYTDVHCGPC